MERHFTVTGFVIDGDRTLLHWHPKLSIWLPPGGHIEPNEDPVQAVLREVLEETGFTAEIISPRLPYRFQNVGQLPAPYSLIVADVQEPAGVHQHIDFAYVVRPVPEAPVAEPTEHHAFQWVTEAELRRGDPLPVAACGVDMPVADDVREVALAAIAMVRDVLAGENR
jgi:8-oxo-dGTP pyrophosphatase MutT (NUDIX family)